MLNDDQILMFVVGFILVMVFFSSDVRLIIEASSLHSAEKLVNMLVCVDPLVSQAISNIRNKAKLLKRGYLYHTPQSFFIKIVSPTVRLDLYI